MLKKTLKRLIISLCALLLCGIFVTYVVESIAAIMSEHAEREKSTVRDRNKEIKQEEYIEHESRRAQVASASEMRDMPAMPAVTEGNTNERNSVAATPSPSAAELGEPSESSPWRVIERSESFNGQIQYYSPANVSIDGERVVITSNNEFMGDKRYTSGMIESKYAYLYGKFSFVISVSDGKGLFPAIWLLPAEDKALPEIDIFEMIGSAPDNFYGVVHYMNGSAQSRDYFEAKVPKKDTYHIEFEWMPARLRWSIDGEHVFETSKSVPDEPMYLIANQAVGGQWPGSPDKNTRFPATFTLESWSIEPEWSRPR